MNAAAIAANRRMLGKLGLLTLAMFAFGYLLVPIYRVYCELTGINVGDMQALAKNTQVDASREVLIQLDANSGPGSPWRFQPLAREARAHPGALVQVEYEIENLSDTPVTGQAIPSYGPAAAGAYFKKIECFCFRAQTLAAHEKRRLPVLFVLDAGIPREMGVVTLSYTFFPQVKS